MTRTSKVKPKPKKNMKSFYKQKKAYNDEEEMEFTEVGVQEVVDNSPEDSDDGDNSDEELDMRKLVTQQNKTKKKKSGGFQSMGLTHAVYKGVMKKGYRIPTPIQRKTIPVIMDGKDVVAMARTGSGKTAAFLLPMLERLKTHSAKVGARALILSPTRELALQTMKFTKELGRFTGLKAAVVLGGDRLDNQFAAMHQNPDIIVATPGRFLHVVMEMDLKLKSVEYVVFDEADRLFEMGFAEQLHEIISRLPESRQTLLFSATLPKLLVDFAKAGLTDPALVRLDVDTKLSDQLKIAFFSMRADDKAAALLYILQEVIKSTEQTLVFAATRHHVEYIKELLQAVGIECSYVYSSLDPVARKINVGKFVHKKTLVMIVTDVAARGIDIPMLDNVINYNFPAKAKLFIHRVGRVARAGRSGTAYSLVANDEFAHMLDLHLFLGRPLKPAKDNMSAEESDGVLGSMPQVIVDEQESVLRTVHETSHDLISLKRVADNAYKQYIKSRSLPSAESVKRVKELHLSGLPVHPILGKAAGDVEFTRCQLLDGVRNFKPRQTIFEVSSKGKAPGQSIMKDKRLKHNLIIEKKHQQKQEKFVAEQNLNTNSGREAEDSEDVEIAFESIVDSSARKKRKKSDSRQDTSGCFRDENYIPHWSSDRFEEKGLGLSTFEKEAAGAVIEITADEDDGLRKTKNMKKWDRKRKRFVGNEGQKSKKIKTESGARIPSSYRTNQYKDWVKKTKLDLSVKRGDEDAGRGSFQGRAGKKGKYGKKSSRKFQNGKPGDGGSGRNELKSKEQILKARHKKEALIQKQKAGRQRNRQRKMASGAKRKR